MKYLQLHRIVLATLALCLFSASIFAQDKPNKGTKKEKVVIIKETVDKDGNKQVKKIVKEGDGEAMIWIDDNGELIELEDGNFEFEGEESINIFKLKNGEALPEEVEKLLEEHNVKIHAPEDGEKIIRIRTTGEGAEQDATIIELDGMGSIPEDVKAKLKAHGIHNITVKEGGNSIILREHNSENQAFLGVKMGKKVEVLNIDGEETTTEEGNEGNGVLIDGVVEGSAAEAAGLQAGDIIKAINGQEIAYFDDLTDQLAGKTPGDVVTIDYQRNGTMAQTEATLGSHDVEMLLDNEEEMEIEVIVDTEGGKQTTTETKVIIMQNGDEERIVTQKVHVIRDGDEGTEEEDVVHPETNLPLERSLDLESFELFPNPTNGQITLQFKAAPVNTLIRITDISGREIYKERFGVFSGEYSDTIDLSEFAKGTFLLSISQGDKVFTERIILK